jgi:predicted nucleic acid-binding protein
MPGFWDASALVPLCVPMQNPRNGRRLLREYTPIVWWGSALEILSALTRLRRQSFLTDPQFNAARARLGALRTTWREIQPSDRLRDLAQERLDRQELRAADALQLAAALVWCNQQPRNRPFLCRDVKLREAARNLGFLIIDL